MNNDNYKRGNTLKIKSSLINKLINKNYKSSKFNSSKIAKHIKSPFEKQNNYLKNYKIKIKNNNNLFHSKSFSEDSNLFNSFSKNHLNHLQKQKTKNSKFLQNKLESDFNGLSFAMNKKEKLLLQKTLKINNDFINENTNENVYKSNNKNIFRKLYKIKKVYDSFSDDEVEILLQNEFVIYPKSNFKFFWDFFIFILVYFSIIVCPLSIAFDIEIKFNIFIDIIFHLDLILNFFMGFYDDEENLILNKKKIFFNYLFGYFTIDVLACLPFNSLKLFNQIETNVYYLCLFRLFKYFKLYSSTNLFYIKGFKKIFCFYKPIRKFFKSKFNNISNGIKTLIQNIFHLFAILHILACIWIYISRLSPGENWTLNLPKKDMNKTSLYLTSIYFSMVSVFTVGYGDILPNSFIERCYSLFLLVLSLGINTYAVSFLENLVDLGNENSLKLERKIEFLQNLAINYKINYNLYEQILNFLKYKNKLKAEEKEKFINILPNSLKNFLICKMYKNIIENFSFFKQFQDDNIEFKSRILLKLRPVIAFKNEDVVIINQFVDEVIFVKSGILSMYIIYKKIKIRLLYLRKKRKFRRKFSHFTQKKPCWTQSRF